MSSDTEEGVTTVGGDITGRGHQEGEEQSEEAEQRREGLKKDCQPTLHIKL